LMITPKVAHWFSSFQRPNAVFPHMKGISPKDIVREQTWIGENPLGDWYYAPDFVYSSDAIIRFLLECVSRDGCYAVNIPISPDGSLVPECLSMLNELGNWMKLNGKGIYGSHAWIKLGEGKDGILHTLPGGNLGKKQAEFIFGPEDFRFTVGKDGKLYAFCMTVPSKGTKLIIKSLGNGSYQISGKVTSVKLLGFNKSIKWKQDNTGLQIICPETRKFKTSLCFQITRNL